MKNSDILNVSVVMCTYNGAAFIADQLNSIVNQTYPVYELIVVDDGSKDDTFAIVQQWAEKYPQIQLHQNSTNLGYNKNFEKALTLATGDVIAISDQDDIWHLHKLAIMLRHWPQHVPLIYCSSVLFRHQVPEQPRTSRLIRMIDGKDPRRLALYNTVSGHAMIIRRELLQLALPFNPDVYYDWWLAVVAAANGGIVFLPQVLVYQRAHSQNATFKEGQSSNDILQQRKQLAVTNAKQFGSAPNLQQADKAFFNQLGALWQQRLEGKNKSALFFFLLRHRGAIYFSKKRNIALISQVKRSFRYAFK
jgi:glycosyltransferase involved in cell wall biosynthesis